MRNEVSFKNLIRITFYIKVLSPGWKLQTPMMALPEEEQSKPLLEINAQNTCSDNNADEKLHTTKEAAAPTSKCSFII